MMEALGSSETFVLKEPHGFKSQNTAFSIRKFVLSVLFSKMCLFPSF
jgi:hypothetical protein